jgi:hypothetical protein
LRQANTGHRNRGQEDQAHRAIRARSGDQLDSRCGHAVTDENEGLVHGVNHSRDVRREPVEAIQPSKYLAFEYSCEGSNAPPGRLLRARRPGSTPPCSRGGHAVRRAKDASGLIDKPPCPLEQSASLCATAFIVQPSVAGVGSRSHRWSTSRRCRPRRVLERKSCCDDETPRADGPRRLDG